MNHKFKVGDTVEVKHSGWGCAPNEIGTVVTITHIGDYDGDPGYKVTPEIGNTKTGGFDGFIGEESFKLVESAPAPGFPSDVFMICDAYEAGVGDGMRSDIIEPRCVWTKGTNEEEAYHIGFKLGKARLERSKG